MDAEKDFIIAVLALFDRCDARDDLLWHVADGQVFFSVNCSDCFAWASADLEPIDTDKDLELVGQCAEDLSEVARRTGESPFLAWGWLACLYAARKRAERPMPAFVKTVGVAPYRALFEAAGPERESTFWAP